MNYVRACHLLEIDPDAINISQEFIKKKYYIQALRNHPDKNVGNETTAAARFQEITAAYDFLRAAPIEEKTSDAAAAATAPPHTFAEFLANFLCTVLRSSAAQELIQVFVNGSIRRALEIFATLPTAEMISFIQMIKKYRAMVEFATEKILDKMEEIARNRAAPEIIVLNPSVENLLDYSLYKLSFGEDVFLVPLWHQELVYESRDKKTVVVQCIPDLPDGITLDENNHLYVKLCCSVYDVLYKEKIQFLVGERSFFINCDDIKCKQLQEIVLCGVGIPPPVDFFDNSVLGNIVVQLHLV